MAAGRLDLESSARSLNHQSWRGEEEEADQKSKENTPLLKRLENQQWSEWSSIISGSVPTSASAAGGLAPGGGGDQQALGRSSASYSAITLTAGEGRGLYAKRTLFGEVLV